MSTWLSIDRIAADVNSGTLSAESNVSKALELIDKGEEFQAVIAKIEERAYARARQIDAQVKQGKSAGRLAGVPFIAKDNFLTFGSETTAASNILRGFSAPYQATVIERLEAEGAICVAKANLDAFAHGSSTENSDFFVTKNPHNKELVAGGSSGGSAAAVALDMTPFAIGSDTGGSIRLPASFTGVVGYKPSYGLVSRSGVVAMASSTDSIGPIAKTVQDAALVLDIMAGRDELDSTTVEKDIDGYLPSEADLSGVKVGVIKEYQEGLSDGMAQRINEALDKIKAQGAVVEQVSLPSLPLALAVYYIICPAEVSSNLSRYDGQRYGYSSPSATNLDESYELSREEGFGAEAKRRIMMGAYVLSSGYYDAYYQKAQIVRTKVINEFAESFKKYDLLVGPTAPMTAFKIGEKTADPLQMYLTDIMTVAANISGNPAISIPAGVSDELPVGLQLIADYRADKKLLQLSRAVEKIL
jgi:aspartyl-tRNA(Asn)/glutamyl-tRNA(Gln) amidotransferase subunit A